MPPTLEAVCLISGGKDSLYSILHCQANGVKVVALANLRPQTRDNMTPDDIDSFMYQTIGHKIIPLYEDALGIPLYQQEITGTALDQNKSYRNPTDPGLQPSDGRQPSDEVESLLMLLRNIKNAHPTINAVSTGAILSDYQRTRVESVALRLGLVPLSFLWQYPFLPPYRETSLLDDMMAVGQDSRIIKVASGGLDDSFLWANVASERTKRRLVRAMEPFGASAGGAALGEGGEYETLALDGPFPLWKKRINIEEADRSVGRGDGGVFSLSLSKATTVPKPVPEDLGGVRVSSQPARYAPPVPDHIYRSVSEFRMF